MKKGDFAKSLSEIGEDIIIECDMPLKPNVGAKKKSPLVTLKRIVPLAASLFLIAGVVTALALMGKSVPKTPIETGNPMTEAPKTEKPKTESPKTESPKTECPDTEEPKTKVPVTGFPGIEDRFGGGYYLAFIEYWSQYRGAFEVWPMKGNEIYCPRAFFVVNIRIELDQLETLFPNIEDLSGDDIKIEFYIEDVSSNDPDKQFAGPFTSKIVEIADDGLGCHLYVRASIGDCPEGNIWEYFKPGNDNFLLTLITREGDDSWLGWLGVGKPTWENSHIESLEIYRSFWENHDRSKGFRKGDQELLPEDYIHGIDDTPGDYNMPIWSYSNGGGKCGKNVFWKFLRDEKMVSVFGCGEMYDYAADIEDPKSIEEQSICRLRDCFDGSWGRILRIEKGVTRIGDNAFASIDRLREVFISDSVTEFGDSCFKDCPQLHTIYFEADEVPENFDPIKAGCEGAEIVTGYKYNQ